MFHFFFIVNVYAMSPVLPDDSVILSLPFGGAVLQKIGVSKPEIDAILEDSRKMYVDDKELDEGSFDFLTSFRRRLPPSFEETPKEEPRKISAADQQSLDIETTLITHAEAGFINTIDSTSILPLNESKLQSPDFYLGDVSHSSPSPSYDIHPQEVTVSLETSSIIEDRAEDKSISESDDYLSPESRSDD